MFISHMHLCLSLVGYPDFTRLKCFWYKVRCHFYNDLSRKKPPCEFDNYLEGNEHAKMIERSFEYGFFTTLARLTSCMAHPQYRLNMLTRMKETFMVRCVVPSLINEMLMMHLFWLYVSIHHSCLFCVRVIGPSPIGMLEGKFLMWDHCCMILYKEDLVYWTPH